jgi:antitoxin component of MazEF toxin-antitoxin module
MKKTDDNEQDLRSQIESVIARHYPTDDIETRIADTLIESGEFHEDITAAELAVILRNVVYVMFAQQKVAGVDVGILHNVPIMKVTLAEGQADIEFVVHVHKPIIAFLEFKYALINDHDTSVKRLTVKNGSLRVNEKTRRFDLKAKAALAAMNVPRIARQEMSDTAAVIRRTLPTQLQQKGITGELKEIVLRLNSDTLSIYLQGDFIRL